MVLIQITTYTRICPFSKSLIKPPNFTCIFNEKQFIAFKKVIYKQFPILPNDIIDLIIKKTGYEKLLNKVGHEKFTHWTAYTKSEFQMRKILYNNYNNNYNNNTDSDSDSELDDE